MSHVSFSARHEAAHAVVAIYLGLSISKVTIESSVMGNYLAGGCVLFNGLPETATDVDCRFRHMQLLVTLVAPRVDAARHPVTGEMPNVAYASDDELFVQLSAELGIPDEQLRSWREWITSYASAILALPHVEDAIDAVAKELGKSTIVPPDMVRNILSLYEGGYPASVLVPHLPEWPPTQDNGFYVDP